jgi:hypothetical protein
MTGEPIVVGRGAITVARSVGPTAWTVLTALGLDSDWTGDSVLTLASVRSLGALLRLNKDTVARALGRLRDAGLVVHEAGCFEPSVYRLSIPPRSSGSPSTSAPCRTDLAPIRPSRRPSRDDHLYGGNIWAAVKVGFHGGAGCAQREVEGE